MQHLLHIHKISVQATNMAILLIFTNLHFIWWRTVTSFHLMWNCLSKDYCSARLPGWHMLHGLHTHISYFHSSYKWKFHFTSCRCWSVTTILLPGSPNPTSWLPEPIFLCHTPHIFSVHFFLLAPGCIGANCGLYVNRCHIFQRIHCSRSRSTLEPKYTSFFFFLINPTKCQHTEEHHTFRFTETQGEVEREQRAQTGGGGMNKTNNISCRDDKVFDQFVFGYTRLFDPNTHWRKWWYFWGRTGRARQTPTTKNMRNNGPSKTFL